jgi:putative DNA primase/helicase
VNLRDFAAALNGDINGDRISAPGPGHSRHDRSLTVWIDHQAPDGFRVHSHATDDFKLCRDHVRECLGLAEWRPGAAPPRSTIPPARPGLSPQRDDADRERIDRAMTIWKEGTSPRGTSVEVYLLHRRLLLQECVLKADALRFHPACPFRLDDGTTVRLPAMLSLMRDIRTNEPRAIHRTALHEAGRGKSELAGLGNAKKMLGPSKNAVIKLAATTRSLTGSALPRASRPL